jgi:outer membrane protein assembly factor BamB
MSEGLEAVANPATASASRQATWTRVRFILAWLMTLGALLYAWARVYVFGRIGGRPETIYVVLLIGGLLAIMALTWRLSTSLPRSQLLMRLLFWVGLPWTVANALLVGVYTSAGLPVPVVIGVFVPSTLWVVWLAWIFCIPLNWGLRLLVLVLLMASCAVSTFSTRITLAGDAQLAFEWGWSLTPSELGALRADSEIGVPAGTVDLSLVKKGDYPQYLGPERLGIAPDVHLARDWNERPPQLKWRKAIGAGWGAFAVAGGFAVTQEQRGEKECVVCYRVSDGAVAWIHDDAADYESSMGGPGPRATPTIADGRVYAVGATGVLNCLDGANGRALWTKNINDDNQASGLAFHGVCGSPLVVDDLVVVAPTGSNGISLAAYRCGSGERVWAGGRDQASYGSPALATLAGVRQILLTNAAGVAGHDLKTGAVLWSFPWTNDQTVNCSQPLVHVGGQDQVFISSGYSKGCALFKVAKAADGSWSTELLKESRHMKTKFTTPILHEGHVYGLDEGILECLDPKKPQRPVWKDGRYQHGQILLAADLLVVQTENGPVVLVEASPSGLHELGRIPALSSKTWNNPALAGKYLLVRNDREAACYELPLAEPQ